jgi:hypothetical protein
MVDLPPTVIVLGFNILLERKRPTMPGPIHFLILLAASVTVFGVGFSVAWLIGRYCTVVYSFSIHTVKS